MISTVKRIDGEFSVVSYVKYEIKSNRNFVCLFQGPTGVGKTWAGISFAHLLDPTFDTRTQVVFDIKGFLNLMNTTAFKEKKTKIILFDEPQISISNRQWQSTNNQVMNSLLSTFRHQNVILIFAAPYKDFLDSQSMKMLHCVFKCEGVNRKKQTSMVLPRLQQYNVDMKKTYQHCIKVISNKKARALVHWSVPIPPMEAIQIYEKAKTDFTARLNAKLLEKINKASEPEKDESKLTHQQRRPLPDGQLRVLNTAKRLFESKGRKVNHKDIADDLGLTRSSIGNALRAMFKKKVDIYRFIANTGGQQLKNNKPLQKVIR